MLIKRMGEVVDGQYQKYVGMDGDYIRQHFFGKYPELLKLIESYSDEKLEKMRRGGHDPEKVYAAYKMATELNNGRPTVILGKDHQGLRAERDWRRSQCCSQPEEAKRTRVAGVPQSLWNSNLGR